MTWKVRFFTILLLFCVGCNNTPANQNRVFQIDTMEVYSISRGINAPLPITFESIKSVNPFNIHERTALDSIEVLINNLERSTETKFIEDVYLHCNIYRSDGSKQEMSYNKFEILFDGRIYKNDPNLIQFILEFKP